MDERIKLITQERIETLKAEIFVREQELERLSKKLINEETDIHKKFVAWANNGLDKETQDSIADGAIRTWCDKHLDLGSMRGCVNLLEYDDSFGLFAMTAKQIEEDFDEEYIKENLEKELEKLKQDEIFIAACEQMIKEDMDGFEIDW